MGIALPRAVLRNPGYFVGIRLLDWGLKALRKLIDWSPSVNTTKTQDH
jgi:hypothetical protein